MTFLDKGSTVKETLGVRSENNALRAVRAKREADEAGQCPSTWFSHRLVQVRFRQGIPQGGSLVRNSPTSSNEDIGERLYGMRLLSCYLSF